MAIIWKKVSEHTPTNVNKHYPGSPETPFVSCIVWVCNPVALNGGVPVVIRWDTKNKCWLQTDMVDRWLFGPPYEITHFCDDINIPEQKPTNELSNW
jgi:hypothetical protein